MAELVFIVVIDLIEGLPYVASLLGFGTWPMKMY